jgi:AraC-like DNA-binding protein
MKAKYQHISKQRSASFSIKKYDNDRLCTHEGLHYHHSYEIVFIKNGSGKIIVGNQCQEYENGALIFLGPCIPHFSFFNSMFDDNFEIVVHFDEVFVEQRIQRIPEFSSLIPFIHKSAQILLFPPDFKEKQLPFFEEIIDLSPIEQLAAIFNLLCRLSTANYQHLLETPIGKSIPPNQQTKKIFDFINENYAQPMSTKDVAQHLNLTTNSFCKVFKKLTNKSFISYLNEYRIYRAVNLIEQSEDSISEIAMKCGFDNLSYFSKVFFQVKNRRPIDYKKEMQLRK